VVLGRLIEATNTSALGLTLYRRLGDRMGEAQMLLQRGNALSALGRTEQAMTCYTDTLSLSRRQRLQTLETTALNRIARIRLTAGDAEAAAGDADQAAKLAKEIGFTRGRGQALATLGRALAAQGQIDRAVACLREAMDICAPHGVDARDVKRALAELDRAAAG
jgi:tetratricopeptide (TPR) repeat protein